MVYCACQHLLRGDGRVRAGRPADGKRATGGAWNRLYATNAGLWGDCGEDGYICMRAGENAPRVAVDTRLHLPRIKIYQTPSYPSCQSERAAIVLLNPLPPKGIAIVFSYILYTNFFFFIRVSYCQDLLGGRSRIAERLLFWEMRAKGKWGKIEKVGMMGGRLVLMG